MQVGGAGGMCMCEYVCVCRGVVCAHESRCPWKPEPSDLPEARATWGCAAPEVGAGTLSQTLCKTSKAFLTTEPLL